jgi:hypothetical protein
VYLPGDLLFQERCDGPLEMAIGDVAKGVNGCRLNHVALFMGDNVVLEAAPPDVHKISLAAFLQLSKKDEGGFHCVMIGRLKAAYRGLIAIALEKAQALVGSQYDPTFGLNQAGYYCSQLIVKVFQQANGGVALFEQSPMSFKNPTTGQVDTYWLEHYRKLGLEVPEGVLGSHPAKLSRSEKIEIIVTTRLDKKDGLADCQRFHNRSSK